MAMLGGCDTSIYYPAPLPPAKGWISACDGEIDATVSVENDGGTTVAVYELLPDDRCNPASRGSVEAGATTSFGKAVGRIWRIQHAETDELLGTFELVDGDNVLQVP